MNSISHGTLRDEDLLEAFADELERLTNKSAKWSQDNKNLIKEARDELEILRDDEEIGFTENSAYLVNETLPDALNQFAKPYQYFGAHQGDGSDFGFWIDHDAIDEAIHDGEIIRVADLSEVSKDIHSGQSFLVVNDHGNMSLYHAVVELKEDWSVV